MTVWPVRVVLVVLAILCVWLGAGGAGVGIESPPLVSSVDAIAITVADADRSVRFYRDVLGFEPVGDARGPGGRILRMRLGDEEIELIESPGGRPLPADSRSNDRWFQHIAIVVNDMAQAHLWLQRHRVAAISPEPQRLPDWNHAAGGIQAFYFQDPDGHPLEILQFPPDKGQARWHEASDRVFLGIDHTAIVVRDTEASLRIYRDRLGFRVAGTSENHGPEQERLNAVAGARLRITTLRAHAGPGVELLEYLHPRDGRSQPADARATDLAHWQTIMTADVTAARVVRDPDGHALRLRRRAGGRP
jgi:catechol 2,3-dioxygenase-like lactoylglutathione lyase family enzyme